MEFTCLTFKNTLVESRYRKQERITMIMTAKTLTGTHVTITDHEIITENGKIMVVFFTKTDNGFNAIYTQNQLTDYATDYGG